MSIVLFFFCFLFFYTVYFFFFFFFSSRRRHTRSLCDWSSDVCSSDLSTQTESSHPGLPPARFASFSVLPPQISLEPGDPSLVFLKVPLQHHSDDQRQHLSYFLRLKYPMRSSTALAIKGNATVASSNTSAKRPPSSGGTNFPQETASVYVLPLKPPQWTGSGQMRTP